MILTFRLTFITAFQLFSSILRRKLSLVIPAEFTIIEGAVLNLTLISSISDWTDLPTETSTGRAKCSERPPKLIWFDKIDTQQGVDSSYLYRQDVFWFPLQLLSSGLIQQPWLLLSQAHGKQLYQYHFHLLWMRSFQSWRFWIGDKFVYVAFEWNK